MSEVELLDHGICLKLQVIYTFKQSDELVDILYDFYTNDFSDEGFEKWSNFIDLITKNKDNKNGIIFIAKRNEPAMYELVNMCMKETTAEPA
jgi:hypothetical protein